MSNHSEGTALAPPAGGLSSREAAARLARDGPNVLPLQLPDLVIVCALSCLGYAAVRFDRVVPRAAGRASAVTSAPAGPPRPPLPGRPGLRRRAARAMPRGAGAAIRHRAIAATIGRPGQPLTTPSGTSLATRRHSPPPSAAATTAVTSL